MLKYFEYHNPTNKFSVSPAAEHLFKIQDNAKPLLYIKAKVFCEFTTKGLYLTKQPCQDKRTEIGFLFTQVKNPNKDDWKKLIYYMR